MNSTTIYWITRLNHFHSFLSVMIVLIVFFGLIYALCKMGPDYEATQYGGTWTPTKGDKGVITGCFLLIILFGAAKALMPTTKEMCAIIAIPAIVNDADVQEIGADIMQLGKEWIKEQKEAK